MYKFLIFGLVTVFLTGIYFTNDAFGEPITYTSDINKFSITVEEWYAVDDNYGQTTFTDSDNETYLLFDVSKVDGLALKDMDMKVVIVILK